jgi:hypothetical protein
MRWLKLLVKRKQALRLTDHDPDHEHDHGINLISSGDYE